MVETYAGRVIGDGHCVAFVREVAGLPHTSAWRRGELVRGSAVLEGTPIATFDRNGRYANATDGSSHAAVLIEETPMGLMVWDQWKGHPVERRLIRFQDGKAKPANDGDKFHVIET
jgi:hypothetical protein